MALTSELISQFVKATNDKTETKKESTVYGTIVIYEGSKYVKLDGSDLLTPIDSMTVVEDGDRVMVTIKNHSATVTGNVTSPSASDKSVQEMGTKISEFEIVIAGKVSTDVLNAEVARIDALTADNVLIKNQLTAAEGYFDELRAKDVEIEGKLTADEAEIETLKTSKLDADVANLTYATIENLNATNADVYNLKATYGEFEVLTTDKFTAIEADIVSLETDKLDAETANITYATIDELNATKADISVLQGDVADIDTLIFGSATGDVISTSFANAVIAQLGNAQIKAAMIESLAASQITAGDIITNNVRVMSEDGKLLISDETIQISDSTRVRVQIGKDAAGDYSINIWDADGNLMFSEGGITDSAIKDAIIRDDMVSDTANISAHKLNITSLFEEINGSEHTINSTQIYMNDQEQTLNIAFTSMVTDLEALDNTVSSQGTDISVIQGQISTKVWQEDINTATTELGDEIDELSTKYSAIEQDLDSVSVTVANHTSQIADKADQSTVTTISNQVTELEADLAGFQVTVSETYTTKTEFNDLDSDVTSAVAKIADLEMDAESITLRVASNEQNIVNAQNAADAAQADIDNLEIGGRNLLFNSKGDFILNWVYAGNGLLEDSEKDSCVYVSTTAVKETYLGPPRTKRVEQSTEYMFSCDIFVNEYVSGVDFFWLSDTEDNPKTGTSYTNVTSFKTNYKPTVGVWQRVAFPFTTKTDDYTGYIRIDNNGTSTEGTEAILKVANLKLEKGNKATDWTPAPEDMATVTELESKIEQTSESILLEVSGTYATKTSVSDLVVTTNGISSRVSVTEDTLNNLQVGGRNLIADTDEITEFVGNAGTSTYTDVWTGKTIVPPEDTEYIVSFDAKADVAQNITCFFYSPNTTTSAESSTGQKSTSVDGNCSVSLTTEWERYWVKWTQTPADTVKSIIVGRNSATDNIYIRAVKFESGNRPTDWTPAPEDVGEDISAAQSNADEAKDGVANAETRITQLANAIASFVTGEDGTSLMTQTETGWTFSMTTKDLINMIGETASDIGDVEESLGETDAALNTLIETVTKMQSEYVKIGTTTYTDENNVVQTVPCIELGEGDSAFKLAITNSKIVFIEGGTEPTKITNEGLVTENITINESLKHGNFVWKQRANGNYGLQYVSQ